MSTDITKIFSGGFVAASVMEEIRQDPEAAFLGELTSFGLEVEYLDYERIVRCKARGDKGGDKSGWYIYFPSGIAAGSFGDWRSSESQSWSSKSNADMSLQDIIENKRRIEKARALRAEQTDEERRAAADTARNIIEEAADATDANPYLQKKQVKAYPGIKIHGNKLIIPACDDTGAVTTVQTIDSRGTKMFLKGGKKSGAYFLIDGSRDKIYICEGYATGATIREATGCAVIVAFDAGNVVKVAPIIRSKYLSAPIVIAADNDQFKPENGNAGVKCAKEASEAIGADIIIPQFANLDQKPTDFNDLMLAEGMDRVKEQLGHAQRPLGVRVAFELTRVDGLEIKPINWLVNGYLEDDSLALAFGEPGCGKSFVAVDIACCVATGTSWHGHEVRKGLVIYIAGEGHNGLARRFKGWEKCRDVSLKGAPLYKSHRASQLYDQAAAIQVAEAVRAISEAEGEKPAMIIIDTVARNMGGDENSTQDMNRFIEHIDALLRHPYGACVLLIHHSGKASPGQARGSTALRGALDSEYMVEMDSSSKMIVLSNKKMKDGEIPAEKRFSIKQVGLGVYGGDGAEITGAALETVDISGLIDQAKGKSESLTKNQRKAMVALESLIFARSRDGVEVPITTDDWRDASHEQGLERNRFREAKDALAAKKIVLINSVGVVTIPSETVRKDEIRTDSVEVKVNS